MTVLQDASRTYERDGYLTSIDIFAQQEIAHFRRLFDRLEEREGRETCQIGLQSWHFKEEFIKREKSFLKNGGKFIFPLPKLKVVK